MAAPRFAQEYRKNAVNGSSPLQLIIMLYDGALRFIEGGKRCMSRSDIEGQNRHLQKAQAIIIELMSCLDQDGGGEVASNLMRIYTYVLEELVQANIHDDPVRLDGCCQILSQLRESWDHLFQTGAHVAQSH